MKLSSLLTKFFLCISLFFCSSLGALTWTELEAHYQKESWQELDGQEVLIRGFGMSYGEGEKKQWVLSALAGLKSCCLGKKEFLAKQIFLNAPPEGYHDELSGSVLPLRGTLKVKPTYNKEGQLTQLFFLEQAHIEAFPEPDWRPTVFVSTLLAICGLGVWVYRHYH